MQVVTIERAAVGISIMAASRASGKGRTSADLIREEVDILVEKLAKTSGGQDPHLMMAARLGAIVTFAVRFPCSPDENLIRSAWWMCAFDEGSLAEGLRDEAESREFMRPGGVWARCPAGRAVWDLLCSAYYYPREDICGSIETARAALEVALADPASAALFQ